MMWGPFCEVFAPNAESENEDNELLENNEDKIKK